MRRALLACLSVALLPSIASACWAEAAQRYGVSADLLYAVARTESNLNPQAVNRGHFARTHTYDIGLMQINSGHLATLARYGITEADLYDPCTNIAVGAWLLAGSFARLGVSWDAVGAYNAACTALRGSECASARSAYAWRVYQRLPNRAPNSPRAPGGPSANGSVRAVAVASAMSPGLMATRVSP